MDFESPDVEKDFPGLYASESKSRGQDKDSEYSDEEKISKKDLLISKRKDKKDKKDVGYMAFEGESSDNENDEPRNHTKHKKSKSFKFPILADKKEKASKNKEAKKEEELTKKEGKKKKEAKVKLPKSKDKKKHHRVLEKKQEKPIFGAPLHVAVEMSKCHDGIELPRIVRECLDYIEEHGLSCSNIYRTSGMKSKIRRLQDEYNQGIQVCLFEHEPRTVASLLKQYLRELPEPILTSELASRFEEAAGIKNEEKKIEALNKLLASLPTCNRLLLSWMMVHMKHITNLESYNGMNVQNMMVVMGPVLRLPHSVLTAFFTYHDRLFKNVQIKKYIPPPAPSGAGPLSGSESLPTTPAAIAQELAAQETVLNRLHTELSQGLRDPQKEEQLWEVQRLVTQLKRKLRFLNQGSSTEASIDTRLQQPTALPSQPPSTVTVIKDVVKPQDDSPEPSAKLQASSVLNQSQASSVLSQSQASSVLNQSQASSVLNQSQASSVMNQSQASSVPNQSQEKSEESSQVQPQIEKVQDKTEASQCQPSQLEATHLEEKIDPAQDPAPTPSEEPEEEVDLEMLALLQEERRLLLEQEELCLLGEELRRKINLEQQEIQRLRADIADYEHLSKYRQYSFDSSENTSYSESSNEEEEEEEDDEEKQRQELENLIKENQLLERKNAELLQQIQHEREQCIKVKVEMKLIQMSSPCKA